MELISKADAVQVIWESVTRESATKKIDELPTIEERKEGMWIDHSNEGYVECPFCGSCTTCEDNIDELHFCFNCGNKLKGE